MKATFDSERHEIVTHSFNRLTTIAALDIGSSKVCCVIARISRDQKISIAGYGYNASKGIKNGIITDIKQATYSVCDAVEAAEQMANERVSRIIVNISGDRVKSSTKASSPMRQERLPLLQTVKPASPTRWACIMNFSICSEVIISSFFFSKPFKNQRRKQRADPLPADRLPA